MADQSSYSRTRERLEEIVTQIKAKDIPLEKSLDLYEEALRLGSTCAEMIDRTDFSADELESATEENAADAAGGTDDVAGDAEAVSGVSPDGDEGAADEAVVSSDDDQPGETEGEVITNDDSK